MKNKSTAGICLLMCVVMVFSLLAACGKKGPADKATTVQSTTAVPGSGEWSGQGLPGYTLVDMTNDEVKAFVKSVLGDAAKDFNGDLKTLTADQLTAVKDAAEKNNYMIDDARGDGNIYIVKTVTNSEIVELSEPELASLIEEALGKSEAAAIGNDTSKLTDEQLSKVTEVAKDKGYTVEKDETGNITISKPEVVQPQATTTQRPATEAEITKAIEDVLGKTRAESFDGDFDKLSQKERDALEKKFAQINASNALLDVYWGKHFPKVPESPTVPATKPVTVPATKPTTKPSGGGGTGGGTYTPPVTYSGTAPTIITATTTPKITTSSYVRSAKNGWLATNLNTLIYSSSAVTSDGGMVAVGNTISTENVGGAIVKYSPDGAVQWSHVIGGNDLTTVNEVAVLKDGGIIAVGETHATNIVGEQYYKSRGTCEGYMAKYNNAGALQWIKLLGGEGADMIYSIAATPDGGYVVGGKSTSTTMDFSANKGAIKAFVFKYDAGGTRQWAEVMSGGKHCAVVGLCVATDNDIYASFETKTTSGDFAAVEGLISNKSANVIMKLNRASGVPVWHKALYESGAMSLPKLAPTPDGGVIAVGQYTASTELNQYVLKGIYNGGATGTTDGVIIKLFSNGSVAWAQTVIGFQNDYLTDINPVTGGYIISGYSASNNRDFAAVGNNGDYDAFVYVIGEYGNNLTMTSMGGTAADTARTVCSNGKGTAYVAGSTSSNDGYFKGKGPSSTEITGAFASKLVLDIK